MTSLFGTEYFGFIASAYAVTATVLFVLVVWILATHAHRKRELDRLEKAGLKRASRSNV